MDKIVQYTPIENHYVQVDIVFATTYGINEAILFDKLYRLMSKLEGKIDNGVKWVRLTTAEWIAELPFFSSATIRRTIEILENKSIILSKVFSGRCKWYRCNPQYISNQMLSAQNEQIQLLKMSKSSAQNEQLPNNPSPNVHPKNNGSNEPAAVGAKTVIRNRFLELTHLAMPTAKKTVGFWWSQFNEILTICGTVEKSIEVMEYVIGYMSNGANLPITGPQSITNLCRARAAGQNFGNSSNGAKPQRERIPLRHPGTGEIIEGAWEL